MEKKSIGRPQKRWLNRVNQDIRMLDVGWKEVIQDKDRWRAETVASKTWKVIKPEEDKLYNRQPILALSR